MSNLWSVAGNWEENSAPEDGDDLVFPPGAQNTETENDLTAGTLFNSLTFTGDAYLLNGNGIALGMGGIVQNAPGSVSTYINLPIELTAVRPVVMSGNATGVMYLSGVVSGAGGLDVESTTTENRSLYLDTAHTFQGGISLTGLYVNVENDSAFGTGTVVVVDSSIRMGGHTISNELEVEGCGPLAGGAAMDGLGTWSGTTTLTGDTCLGLFVGAPGLEIAGAIVGNHRITAARNASVVVVFSADSPDFTGTLEVGGGTVYVNADLSDATADLSSSPTGSVLGGTGRVGNTTIGSGSHLAAGTSPGQLMTGNLSMTSS